MGGWGKNKHHRQHHVSAGSTTGGTARVLAAPRTGGIVRNRLAPDSAHTKASAPSHHTRHLWVRYTRRRRQSWQDKNTQGKQGVMHDACRELHPAFGALPLGTHQNLATGNTSGTKQTGEASTVAPPVRHGPGSDATRQGHGVSRDPTTVAMLDNTLRRVRR